MLASCWAKSIQLIAVLFLVGCTGTSSVAEFERPSRKIKRPVSAIELAQGRWRTVESSLQPMRVETLEFEDEDASGGGTLYAYLDDERQERGAWRMENGKLKMTFTFWDDIGDNPGLIIFAMPHLLSSIFHLSEADVEWVGEDRIRITYEADDWDVFQRIPKNSD